MRILITGGTGFLGSHLTKELEARKHEVVSLGSTDGDLTDTRVTTGLVDYHAPDCVIHCAAKVGGIQANLREPARFWLHNLTMGINILEACRIKSKRLVLVGTTCSYPNNCPTPFHEEALFDGYPEISNAPYGIAKRALVEGARAYRKQYGMDVRCVIPANLYGPGDALDPGKSHVVPALMMKFINALRDGSSVQVWGNGKAQRDLLYVEDAARGIAKVATCKRLTGEPINLGSGRAVTIERLATMIKAVSGFKGKIVFERGMPNGQMKRRLDINRAKIILGWRPHVTLQDGLNETYRWVLEEMSQ